MKLSNLYIQPGIKNKFFAAAILYNNNEFLHFIYYFLIVSLPSFISKFARRNELFDSEARRLLLPSRRRGERVERTTKYEILLRPEINEYHYRIHYCNSTGGTWKMHQRTGYYLYVI